MKKITLIILAAFLLFGTITTYAVSRFSDVKESNWAYKAIEAAVNTNVVTGYPDGSYKPNKTISYGEFIKMAYIAGTNGWDPGNAKSGHWATNYFNDALKLGYFTEDDIKASQLNNGITRGDMGLIIGSMISERIDFDKEGVEFRFTVGEDRIMYDAAAKMADDLLTDIDSNTKHKDMIILSYLNGILTGYSDSTFRPNNTLTRAEAAAVFHRIIDPEQKVTPDILKITLTDEKIDEMLNKDSAISGLTNGEYLGVSSAVELKKEKPITYYSYISKEKKPIGEAIYNTDIMANPNFICKYYKIVNPGEIGFTSIKKTVDKYNSELIEVLPGNKFTSAVLIKNGNIVCELSQIAGSETTSMIFFPGTDKYYNGNYKNNVLMDFDYIGFWTHPGDTIFLVNKSR